jgi:hypothetical protein
MPIPDVPQSRLFEAMAEFDQTLREHAEWRDWENNLAYRYAIDRDGKRYPPKKIVSLASGAPVSAFSGGVETVNYLKSRGVTVIELQRTTLQSAFNEILDGYGEARISEPFNGGSRMAKVFDTCERLLANEEVIGHPTTLRVKASIGQGN